MSIFEMCLIVILPTVMPYDGHWGKEGVLHWSQENSQYILH